MASREPISIEIFDERDPVAGVANHIAFTRSRGASAAGSSIADQRGGPSDAAPAAGSSLMTMRRPELSLDAASLEAIAGHGELPSPIRISGRLENQPGQTGVIHDAVANIAVERDGSVHIHDKPNIDIHLMLPVLPDIRKDLRDIGQSVAEWYADPYAGERYNRTMDLPQHLQAVPGQCDTYGDGMCDDALAPEAKVMKNGLSDDDTTTPVIAGGRLDLTAYLSKKLHVGDVYASRKLKLLDDTRDERVARGNEFRADQLARSAELMRGATSTGSPRPIRRSCTRRCSSCGTSAPRATARSAKPARARERRSSAGSACTCRPGTPARSPPPRSTRSMPTARRPSTSRPTRGSESVVDRRRRAWYLTTS